MNSDDKMSICQSSKKKRKISFKKRNPLQEEPNPLQKESNPLQEEPNPLQEKSIIPKSSLSIEETTNVLSQAGVDTCQSSKKKRKVSSKKKRKESNPPQEEPIIPRPVQPSLSIEEATDVLYRAGIQEVTVENLVYTCKLNCQLNLCDVTTRLSKYGVQCNPKKFAAAILKLREPRIAVLLFGPGKCVCTGSKVHSQAVYVIKHTVQLLREKVGIKHVKASDITIQNVVTSTCLPWRVDLVNMAEGKNEKEFCSYNPELFPGLIFRDRQRLKRTTLLFFTSGKVVIVGAKSKEEAKIALATVFPIVSKYKTNLEKGKEIPSAVQDEKFEMGEITRGIREYFLGGKKTDDYVELDFNILEKASSENED